MNRAGLVLLVSFLGGCSSISGPQGTYSGSVAFNSAVVPVSVNIHGATENLMADLTLGSNTFTGTCTFAEPQLNCDFTNLDERMTVNGKIEGSAWRGDWSYIGNNDGFSGSFSLNR